MPSDSLPTNGFLSIHASLRLWPPSWVFTNRGDPLQRFAGIVLNNCRNTGHIMRHAGTATMGMTCPPPGT
eukprot:9786509-Prorocentrum_lima.AAC.1